MEAATNSGILEKLLVKSFQGLSQMLPADFRDTDESGGAPLDEVREASQKNAFLWM